MENNIKAQFELIATRAVTQTLIAYDPEYPEAGVIKFDDGSGYVEFEIDSTIKWEDLPNPILKDCLIRCNDMSIFSVGKKYKITFEEV